MTLSQGAFEKTSHFLQRQKAVDSATQISIFIQTIDDQVDTQKLLAILADALNTTDAKLIKIEFVDESTPFGRRISRKAFFNCPMKEKQKR